MEVLIYILKSSVILAFFYSVYRLFLQRETFFAANRYFLLAGVLVSVIAPALVFKQVIYLETAPTFNLNTAQFIKSGETTAEATGLDWWHIALLGYLSGCCLMLVLFFKKLGIVFSFLRKNAVTIEDGYKYIDVEGLKTPFSFFHYIAFGKNEHTPEELEIILEHERVHAKQLHTIDTLLIQLLLVTQWFNPVAWLYRNAVEENLEFLADSSASQKIPDSKIYQLTLVKVSISERTPALAHTFYHSFIKKRIIMLNKQSSQNYKKFKMLLVLPVLAAFMWSFNVQETIEYREPATKKVQEIFDPVQLTEEEKAPQNAEFNSEVLEDKTRISTNASGKSSDSKEAVSIMEQETKLKPFKKLIRSTATREEINAIAKNLKEEFKVDLKVENLEYNSDGHITGIKLRMKDLSTKNMTTTQLNGAKPIPDLLLYRTEEGTFGISSAAVNTSQNVALNPFKEIRNMTKEEEAEFFKERKGKMEERKQKMDSSQKTIYIIREGNEVRRKEMEQRREETRAKADEMMERAKNREINASESKDGEEVYLSNTNILLIVDGKEVPQSELNKIDHKSIESITVLKGEKASELYKDRMDGKEGVILIVLKKE